MSKKKTTKIIQINKNDESNKKPKPSKKQYVCGCWASDKDFKDKSFFHCPNCGEDMNMIVPKQGHPNSDWWLDRNSSHATPCCCPHGCLV